MSQIITKFDYRSSLLLILVVIISVDICNDLREGAFRRQSQIDNDYIVRMVKLEVKK